MAVLLLSAEFPLQLAMGGLRRRAVCDCL